jgi:hypothetical protein
MKPNATLISKGLSSQGTKLILEDGRELSGLTRVQFTAEVNDINRISAELFSSGIEAQGQLTLMMNHPETGELKEVSKIQFVDGSEWSVPE